MTVTCARVLELVDTSVFTDEADRPPVILPRRLTLDGHVLPEGCRVVDLDYGSEWPLTVTLAVPQHAVRYVVTRTLRDGTPLGGRVWIDDVEVLAPNDPISYPAGPDLAYVDVHVFEFRIGAARRLLD